MSQDKPIKYGDVFAVSENIANEPIAPLDAATMQAAETQVLGHTVKGGPAAAMQSAATKNVQSRAVPHGVSTDVGKYQGMTVVARYADPNPNSNPELMVGPPPAVDDAVTIGEALEISAIFAGDKPITQTDASAIQAAEMRAVGCSNPPPGGLGSEAQSAATRNKQIMTDENKITLGDILTDASMKLSHDKLATIQDAEKVIAAELRNHSKMETNLGGVGESIAAAAKLNQQKLTE
ncbi:Late embryogenesis abundant protein 31 [Bienertia sinuspersici]